MAGLFLDGMRAAGQRAKVGLRRATVYALAALRAVWNLVRPPLSFALQVLAAVVSAGKSLRDYTRELTLLPQVLVNVKTAGKADLAAPGIRAAIEAAEKDLAGRGRVLLRDVEKQGVIVADDSAEGVMKRGDWIDFLL